MALISCVDCHHQVSERAPACPHCGSPIATKTAGVGVITTEQTAKKFKGMILLAWALFFIGLYLTFTAGSKQHFDIWQSMTGMLSIVGGLGLWIVTKFRVWWHHA